MIYFLWGSEDFEASLQAEGNQKDALKRQALKRFYKALEYYQQALAMTPHDIFLLDEYARICFNIADLNTDVSEKPALWDAAIQAFVQVICAEDVGGAGPRQCA